MRSLTAIGLAAVAMLLAACGDVAATAAFSPATQSTLDRGAGGGGTKLPTCSGASDCAAGAVVCTGEDNTNTIAPTVIADNSNGLFSDHRGSYVQGTDNVSSSIVIWLAGLSLDRASRSVKNPRAFSVNLSNPVPGGGGVALGTITDGNDNHLEAQWYQVGTARQNLHDIPVGQTVTANQLNVSFHINGHFHILQMGPQAYGHCHAAPTAVFGTGTSTGTIYRASATKWVIDLPAGSIGRLFDLYNTDQYAVDKGLYYMQVHYEIGN
jgi:hypothetical protein